MHIVISDHATIEISRRHIPLAEIEKVLASPQQIIPSRPGREIYQSIIEINSKPYLLRLVADEGEPPILVTVYRTSKIKKYWSQA